MLNNIAGLTGGSDFGRCPFRVACLWEEFLLPREHLVEREDRSSDVVAGQWELAVMTVANWAAVGSGGLVTFREGEAMIRCSSCKRLIPFSTERVEGSGVVFCRDAFCSRADRPVQLLVNISNTAMTEAFNACRRLSGGVRCYPLLRGLQIKLQAPVLHCTGSIAQLLVYFILACLPEDNAVTARQVISAITAKGKVESLYLREFREVVAAAVACPAIFAEDLDSALFGMLQIVQLLNAAWRASLSDPTDVDRSGAAAIARLAIMVLGPLYLNLKPLDPVKKDAKVTTLYMHAALAHVRHSVSTQRGGPAVVTDDNMEGHLRGVGRFIYNNANNASQAALFADLAAVQDASVGFVTARSHPSSLVYTKQMRICKCWTSLSPGGDKDFSALRKVAVDDPELSVLNGGAEDVLVVNLPLHQRTDANGQRRTESNGKPVLGKNETLRRGLRFRQRVLDACHCGKLGGKKSRLVDFLVQKRKLAAAALQAAASGPRGSGAVQAPAQRAAGRGPLHAPRFAGSGAASDESHGDTCSGMSASSERAISTDRGPVGGPAAGCKGPQQPKMNARSRVIAAVAAHVPPRWALGLVLPEAVVRAAGGRWNEEAPTVPSSFRERDAELRKQIAVMRLFLKRTQTYAFVSWTVAEKVAREDVLEAVMRILDRLVAVRTEMVLSRRV